MSGLAPGATTALEGKGEVGEGQAAFHTTIPADITKRARQELCLCKQQAQRVWEVLLYEFLLDAKGQDGADRAMQQAIRQKLSTAISAAETGSKGEAPVSNLDTSKSQLWSATLFRAVPHTLLPATLRRRQGHAGNGVRLCPAEAAAARRRAWRRWEARNPICTGRGGVRRGQGCGRGAGRRGAAGCHRECGAAARLDAGLTAVPGLPFPCSLADALLQRADSLTQRPPSAKGEQQALRPPSSGRAHPFQSVPPHLLLNL